MKPFFNDAELTELFANTSLDDQQEDHRPVVKLFLPDEPITWLLTRIHSNNPTVAFGLTDFGDGQAPHLGWINLDQLRDFEGRYGFEVTKDKRFEADQPLSFYFNQAQQHAQVLQQQINQDTATYDKNDYPPGSIPDLYEL